MRGPIDDIWSLVCNGDADAWDELVRRYEGLVYTVARRVGLSPMDAEDCAQHTWFHLYRNRRRIRDPERLPVWLIQTARRRAIRVYRQLILAGSDQPDESMVSKSPLPDEDVALLERQAHLEHALSLIDPRCRTLLAELFFAPEERSYRDIARKLRIPVNSLGPTRIRCLKKLKKILEELGYL